MCLILKEYFDPLHTYSMPYTELSDMPTRTWHYHTRTVSCVHVLRRTTYNNVCMYYCRTISDPYTPVHGHIVEYSIYTLVIAKQCDFSMRM